MTTDSVEGEWCDIQFSSSYNLHEDFVYIPCTMNNFQGKVVPEVIRSVICILYHRNLVGNGFMLVVPPLGCHRTLNNCLCQGDTDPSQSYRNGVLMLRQNQTNARLCLVCASLDGEGLTQCMGDKHRIMVRPISFSIALLDHYHRNGPVGLLGSYARICWGPIINFSNIWDLNSGGPQGWPLDSLNQIYGHILPALFS